MHAFYFAVIAAVYIGFAVADGFCAPSGWHGCAGRHPGTKAALLALGGPTQIVAAVFDLDGRLFGEAAATPTKVSSLVVTSTGSGEADDRQLQEMVRTGTKTVAVGLLDSQHFDLTDAAAIGGVLRTAGIPFELGRSRVWVGHVKGSYPQCAN